LATADTLEASNVARLPFVFSATGSYGTCSAGTGIGIFRESWNGTGFDPTCVTSIATNKYNFVGDLAAGDFDLNGTIDALWLERDITVQTGPSTFLTGTPQLHYQTATPRVLAVPGGLSAVLAANAGTRQQVVAGTFRGQGVDDVAVLLSNASGRNVIDVALGFTTSTVPSWNATSLDPSPSGPPALGIARCPPIPGSASETLVAWNGTLQATPVTVSASGTPSLSAGTAPTVHVPITVAACGDVNGDGVPDLVMASDSTSVMAIALGDGDGGFGRRPHFRAGGLYAMAQVDGDGVGDVLLATDAPALVTLFGDEHELATGPETPLGFGVAGLWAGDLGGSIVPGWAGDAVLADASSNLWVAMGTAAGTFAKPVLAVSAPAISGRIPRIVKVAFAELGGTGAGRDVLVLYETQPPTSTPGGNVAGTYELDAFIRDATGPQVITTTLTSTQGADFQEVDLDHDGQDEVVFLESHYLGLGSPPQWRPVRLKIDRSGPGRFVLLGALPAYVAGSTNPVALGRSADGVAVFGASAVLDLVWDTSYLTTLLPSGVYAPGAEWNGNVRLPIAAAMGDVTLRAEPDLVLPSTVGAIYVLAGNASGGRLASFSLGTSALAPGSVAGIVPQGLGQRSDVLVFTREELLPLVWSAGVLK
ncbi:MAG TPA: VCBS repeat-containing protein, partial [Anaeromyxobacter sp.]